MTVLKGKRVMVVDDQQMVRGVMSHMAQKLGAKEVFMASSVPMAVDEMMAQRYDLVITDINMEPLSGLYLLKAIRSDTTLSPHDMPVLLVTGNSDGDVVRKAMELDADGFALKPVAPGKLESRIGAAMGPRQPKRDALSYASVLLGQQPPEADEEPDNRVELAPAMPTTTAAAEPPPAGIKPA